ncbi:MAG TPA: hypothetical protein VHD85_00545 [Terracidiphilus sp.]|nr:hypothetical protein [Terracidiphilus sp.]
MSIGGIRICDFCGEPVVRDDATPVKIEEDGHLHQRHFHNRHANDCLAQQLAILQSELVAAE